LAAPPRSFLQASAIDTRCVTDCPKIKVQKTQKTLDICPTCRAKSFGTLASRKSAPGAVNDHPCRACCRHPNTTSSTVFKRVCLEPSTKLIHPPSQPTTVVSTMDRCHMFSSCIPGTMIVLYVESSSIGRFLACRNPRAPQTMAASCCIAKVIPTLTPANHDSPCSLETSRTSPQRCRACAR
jgi:hypothetical protein